MIAPKSPPICTLSVEECAFLRDIALALGDVEEAARMRAAIEAKEEK